MVDTKDLKSFDSNVVRVRVPPWAQLSIINKKYVVFLRLERVLCIFKNLQNLRKYKTPTDLVEVESRPGHNYDESSINKISSVRKRSCT